MAPMMSGLFVLALFVSSEFKLFSLLFLLSLFKQHPSSLRSTNAASLSALENVYGCMTCRTRQFLAYLEPIGIGRRRNLQIDSIEADSRVRKIVEYWWIVEKWTTRCCSTFDRARVDQRRLCTVWREQNTAVNGSEWVMMTDRITRNQGSDCSRYTQTGIFSTQTVNDEKTPWDVKPMPLLQVLRDRK
ncbi:hypothetical protein EV421DRAFT_2016672 [Armillaria borealis]|uniref:Uncharacterized protein n=1 Tax=Armillaria borealis TaxID=47425 RepID=A0AA39MXC0_9AGAR|nr:hypothetical protein EV421DRAFT_2016672 [Armillaria borealis]